MMKGFVMKKIFISSLLALMVLLLAVPALAQQETPELEIRLNRDFGYGGFGNDIQGAFSIIVSGPDDLVEVTFFVDETELGTDREAPYKLQFNTDNFDPGTHRIYAVGVLSDGRQLQTRELVQEFLSAESAGSKTMQLLVPILVITVVVMGISALLPALSARRGKQPPIGEYGMAGGTICPRCQFPFSRNVMSPNMLAGKLERCPHCGKWSIRPRAGAAALAEAEERLRAARGEGEAAPVNEEDSLKRALEESRFEE